MTIVPSAIIVDVTVPVSPVVIRVPVVAGIVIAVVPAIAAGVNVTVPEVLPGIAREVIPARPRLPEARFKAIDVVPTKSDELPRTAEGIVPDKFPAVRFVRLAPETAPNDADHVPEVTVPVVVSELEPARGEAPTVL